MEVLTLDWDMPEDSSSRDATLICEAEIKCSSSHFSILSRVGNQRHPISQEIWHYGFF
jgi:hypothetical protein